MERFDFLAHDWHDGRLLRGGLLSRAPDDELQALVEDAARATGAPIATVSLLLRRTQFFRAHVGLPPDLAQTRTTDRCVSFCQVAAKTGEVLEVEDAERDSRIPRTLVESHGVRAYLGVPVRVGDEIVGTLCVLDVNPRRFSAESRRALEALAQQVEHRLAALSGADDDCAQLADVGVTTLRGAVSELQNDIAIARVAALEITGRIHALERLQGASDGNATANEVLADASHAIGDLSAVLEKLESSARAAQRVLEAADERLDAEGDASLGEIVDLAAAIAGGVPYRWVDGDDAARAPRTRSTATLAIAFSALAEPTRRSGRAIVLRPMSDARGMCVRLRVEAADADAAVQALSASGRHGDAWRADSDLVVRLGRPA